MVAVDTDEIRGTADRTDTIASEIGGTITKIIGFVNGGSGSDLLGNPPVLTDQPGILNTIASTLRLIAADAEIADSGADFYLKPIADAMLHLQSWVDGNEDPAAEAEWNGRIRELLEQGIGSSGDAQIASALDSLPNPYSLVYWTTLTTEERERLIADHPDLFDSKIAPQLPTPAELFGETLGGLKDGYLDTGYGTGIGHLDYDGETYEWFVQQQKDAEYGDGSYWSGKPWIGSPTSPLIFGEIEGAGSLPDGADGMVYVVAGRGPDARREKLEYDTFSKFTVSELISAACGEIPVVGAITGPVCGAGTDSLFGHEEEDDYLYPATVIAAPIDHSGQIIGEPEVISVTIRMPNTDEAIATARENEEGTSGNGPVAPTVGDVIFDMEQIDNIRPT